MTSYLSLVKESLREVANTIRTRNSKLAVEVRRTDTMAQGDAPSEHCSSGYQARKLEAKEVNRSCHRIGPSHCGGKKENGFPDQAFHASVWEGIACDSGRITDLSVLSVR